MKNKISIFIIALVALVGFNACTDDDNLRFQAVESPDQIIFLNDFLSEYVLSSETSNNIAERFIWATPDFGAETAVTYSLETSMDGTFEDTQVISEADQTQVSISVAQMIALAEEKGLSSTQVEDEDGNPVFDENGDPVFNNVGELYFRVRAVIGTLDATDPPETTSAVQIINVRLLLASNGEEPVVSLRNLFLVGNATAADWNNDNNNTPFVRNPENENQYSFTGRFIGDAGTNEFKLLENRGAWQPQWGLDADGALAVNDGSGDDPLPFVTTGATGYYTVDIDIDAASFEMVAFDDSALPTYASLSIIGDSTPLSWDGDTEMTQSTFDVHLWFINGVELVDGEMKVRTTGDWVTNWGSDTPLSGFGSFDGPNIPVAAGNYNIWFNDLDGSYMFIPVE